MKLEHELELAKTETRTQRVHISNLYVCWGIVNRHMSDLKNKLAQVEPECLLLEFSPPEMLEKQKISERETTSEHDQILLDIANSIL